jgi:CDP-diacylglycerol--glycerol-3-phosphate 3-phosphatidyltransferase
MVGAFMVSYGSAKAEGLGASVPPSAMRRAERAVCLCSGVALSPAFAWLIHHGRIPAWSERLPLLVALALVAVIANVSAIRRLRHLASSRAATAAPVHAAIGSSNLAR